MKNPSIEQRLKTLSGVLEVMGHPEYSYKRLNAMRLSAEEAYFYNQTEEIMGAISHRAVFATPSNAVLCIGPKLKPHFLLERKDLRMVEEPLPDIKELRKKCAKAVRRNPGLELPAETEASDAKLLYWAIEEGVLECRANPHLAESGAVLPMSQAVLMQEKAKEARSMKYDQSAAFSAALGSLIVFNLRARGKDKDNNKQAHIADFHTRVRRFNELLHPSGSDDDDSGEDATTEVLAGLARDDDVEEEEEEDTTPAKKKKKTKKHQKKTSTKQKKTKRAAVAEETGESVKRKADTIECLPVEQTKRIKLLVKPHSPPPSAEVESSPPPSPTTTTAATATVPLFTPFSFASFAQTTPLPPPPQPSLSSLPEPVLRTESSSVLNNYFSQFAV